VFLTKHTCMSLRMQVHAGGVNVFQQHWWLARDGPGLWVFPLARGPFTWSRFEVAFEIPWCCGHLALLAHIFVHTCG
jgi:hypothetical protein